MKLYNEGDLNMLLKKTKTAFVFAIVFLSLSIVSLTLFIVFSFYEMKLLFQIVGSIVSFAFAALTIYFFDCNSFFKRIATEYLNILKDEGEKVEVKIIDINRRITTLSDKSTVYEIDCLDNKEVKTIYLSSLFEPFLQKNKSYDLVVALNYVKECYEKD